MNPKNLQKLKKEESNEYYYVIGEIDLNNEQFIFRWLEDAAFKQGNSKAIDFETSEDFKLALEEKIANSSPFVSLKEAVKFKKQ